jgi:hypothetical protein
VIGVVAHQDGGSTPPLPAVFIPFAQDFPRRLVIRSRGNAAALAPAATHRAGDRTATADRR